MPRTIATGAAVWALAVWLGAAPARAAEPTAPPEVKAAMDELWRRGFCLLSSVYQPAAKVSVVPKDIGSLPVLAPRAVATKGALLCHAVDGSTIWAADDQSLLEVDAAAGKVVRRFGPPEGLGAEPIQAILPVGNDVWLGTRGGLARLDRQAGAIQPVADVRFTLGRLTKGDGDAWAFCDSGAYRLPAGQGQWSKLPDFPGRDRLAESIAQGFWTALWNDRADVLMPSVFANADGLYAVCMNRLLHFAAKDGRWVEICQPAWRAIAQGRVVWAMTTDGVVRYDPAGGTERFAAGKGPAAGRPVAMAAGDGGFFLLSNGDYDEKQGKFVGGGISRYDSTAKTWTVTESVDGADIRFATAIVTDGQEAWAAAKLYDRVVQLGAHPGMAHVKRWVPHASGLGLLHYSAGRWTLTKREGLKTEPRWVLGQKGTVSQDRVGPESVDLLCRCGARLWGVYRVVPEHWYSGYFVSAGCLVHRDGDAWQGAFDVRTDQLDLAGEQPDVMLLSQSHGQRIVLADGHPTMLGIDCIAGRTWAVCQSGLFAYDAQADRFQPIAREGFRAYWRVTVAAAGKDAVWFGGDGGTVSRLDRKTGLLELLGVAPGRKVLAIAANGDGVVVRTEAANVCLPVALRSAAKLPSAEVIAFDGKQWSPGSSLPPAAKCDFSCDEKRNYLLRKGSRAAFLKGVFQPKVLCEDPQGGQIWLSTYGGIASVPIPAGT